MLTCCFKVRMNEHSRETVRPSSTHSLQSPFLDGNQSYKAGTGEWFWPYTGELYHIR